MIASHYENDKDVVRELLSLSRNNAACSLHIASFKKMSKEVIDVYLNAAIHWRCNTGSLLMKFWISLPVTLMGSHSLM